MSDGHRLVQAMRQAGRTPQNEIVDIVVGEVISINPLKVRVEKRELTESFLILGALCKESHIYTSNIKKLNHRHIIGEQETNPVSPHDADYDIMLWRGLVVGDRVLMLKVGQGQKYYILQREEGVM